MPTTRSRRLRIAAALTAAAVLTSVVAYRFGADAGAPATPSAIVTITPCRLADTRVAPDNVGTRNTPIGTGENVTFNVWGTNGNCTIPTNATGIIANITIVAPTATGFLTIYPADATQPTASNLNWKAAQGATPNLVTVGLSASGAIKVFNKFGTVQVIIDITAYLLPATTAAVGGRNRISLDQIARLRWDQDPGRVATFATGNNPGGIAFDGTNIWVANSDDNTVSKINLATGTRTDYPTGHGPNAIAYDGTSIWVVNASDDTVSKINPTTGTTAGTYATGNGPSFVVYDGTNIWVTNYNDGNVSKINPATGTVVDTYATGAGPQGIAFDGTNIWVTNYTDSTVSKIDPATGTKTNYPTGLLPQGIAYDGTNIWVANSASSTVSKINPVTGAKTDYATGSRPMNVAYDGTNIWVTCINSDAVSKINPTTGAKTDDPTGNGPIGVAYDGTNIWVTNYTDSTVSRLLPGQ